MAWPANNGREHCPGCIVSSKTSLAHPRTVVDDKSSDIVVAHGLAGVHSELGATDSRQLSKLLGRRRQAKSTKWPKPRDLQRCRMFFYTGMEKINSLPCFQLITTSRTPWNYVCFQAIQLTKGGQREGETTRQRHRISGQSHRIYN